MSLTLRDQAKRLGTPPLQGRGRGWGLSALDIAQLQSRARDMRSDPTEPEKRLWRHLSNGQLRGAKFRRQQVIGWFIADFVCSAAKLIVEVDGDTHDADRDRLRDVALERRGYCIAHVTNADVMKNIDGVLQRISEALRDADTPHPNPSPEGEGLDEGDPYHGMTVNERLFDAGLVAVYQQAIETGDLKQINTILNRVNLRQDATGMNWPLHAQNS